MKVILKVEGMHCQNCVMTVSNSLKGVAGVNGVEVNLEGAEALVDFEGDETTIKTMLEAIDDIGFEAQRQ